jgi:hypothetical protein
MSQFLFTMPKMVTEIHTRFRVKKMPGSITKLISIGISIVDCTNKWFWLHLIFYLSLILGLLLPPKTRHYDLRHSHDRIVLTAPKSWLLIARAIRKMHRVILSEVSFLLSHSFSKLRYKNYFIIFLEGG